MKNFQRFSFSLATLTPKDVNIFPFYSLPDKSIIQIHKSIINLSPCQSKDPAGFFCPGPQRTLELLQHHSTTYTAHGQLISWFSQHWSPFYIWGLKVGSFKRMISLHKKQWDVQKYVSAFTSNVCHLSLRCSEFYMSFMPFKMYFICLL